MIKHFTHNGKEYPVEIEFDDENLTVTISCKADTTVFGLNATEENTVQFGITCAEGMNYARKHIDSLVNAAAKEITKDWED